MWDWLSGKKTYIITAFGALSTVFGYSATGGVSALLPLLLDFLTSPEMGEVMKYGAIAAVRNGIAK